MEVYGKFEFVEIFLSLAVHCTEKADATVLNLYNNRS